MSDKNVLILESKEGAWGDFLKGYFGDVPAGVIVAGEAVRASAAFDEWSPAVLFLEPVFLTQAFLQKLRVRKNTDPSFRAYGIGGKFPEQKEALLDGVFPSVPDAAEFGKCFVETLPLPARVRVLVVDDEREIGEMVRDYFAGRSAPSFEVEHAANGEKALAAIARKRPDVIILDIKMPVMDGREFYARLTSGKDAIPVIIFFDSVSGEELTEIRRYGDPAVIEKGYQRSSLPALMTLVKKLVCFGH
ncbi:MAG TPA: response regulator [Candidatus Omnitrophota bacterium]|nr:response regulator [Candidatus Omnitrophota bacterium]HPS36722.1 response regulator [Candidatus Omnitrophota bacterium]